MGDTGHLSEGRIVASEPWGPWLHPVRSQLRGEDLWEALGSTPQPGRKGADGCCLLLPHTYECEPQVSSWV